MTDKPTASPMDIEHDPTHQAAADWLVRLQDPGISVEDTLAWQAWMSESEANASAFARIEEVSQVLRALPAPPPVSARQLAADGYDASVPLKDWSAPHTRRSPWMAVALAASVAIAALPLAFWKFPFSHDTFSTAIGENRSVTLSDGSTIVLGGDTRIDVSLSNKVRAIELTKGEALFKVARDAARPFKVRAGDATIVAVGTEFDVQRGSDRAVVSVTEGRVMVEPAAPMLPALMHEFMPKLRTVSVAAGQQSIAGSAGIEAATPVEDPAAATAWQWGRLAFRLQPLRYVLEDVNRYAHKPIVLEGDGVGALVVTGTVERENIAGWVESLERAFDLQAAEEADRIVIRAR